MNNKYRSSLKQAKLKMHLKTVSSSLTNRKWNYRTKKINKGQNKSIQPRRTFIEMDEPLSKSSWQITYCI